MIMREARVFPQAKKVRKRMRVFNGHNCRARFLHRAPTGEPLPMTTTIEAAGRGLGAMYESICSGRLFKKTQVR